MILNEGGDVFADTEEYDQKEAAALQAVVNKELSSIGLSSVMIGSGFHPTPGQMSGDLDLQIELQDIIDRFNVQPDPTVKKDTIENAARRTLEAHLQSKGYQTKRAGINVFMRVPYRGKFYQVDLECIYKVAKVSKYHQHKIPQGSTYKGVGKQIMISMLAKEKSMMWSGWEGLFQRTPDNKKGDMVADDLDDIAKVLLGPQYGEADLGSVESILAAMPSAKAQDLLARAKADKAWRERAPRTESLRVGTNEWFRNMLNKL